MIELTPEQRLAVEHGEPVRVVDPRTLDAYVLVRAEVYEHLTGATPGAAHNTVPGIAPGILRSMRAFWRDLPELMKSNRNHGKWVAYHADERVGIAANDVSLIRELARRGIADDDCYLATVRPRALPPWGA